MSFTFDDIFHAMRQFNIHKIHLSHDSNQNLHTQLSYIKTTKKTYFSLCCLSESVTQRRPDINFSRENTSAEKNVTNKNYLLTEGKLSWRYRFWMMHFHTLKNVYALCFKIVIRKIVYGTAIVDLRKIWI